MQLTSTQRKAIDHYYNELEAYHTHKVTHETAVRSAFQNLLAAFAQSANWTLIPEQTLANGKRPDGTLRDTFTSISGYFYSFLLFFAKSKREGNLWREHSTRKFTNLPCIHDARTWSNIWRSFSFPICSVQHCSSSVFF